MYETEEADDDGSTIDDHCDNIIMYARIMAWRDGRSNIRRGHLLLPIIVMVAGAGPPKPIIFETKNAVTTPK
jgi:hypothetical protein